MAEDNEKKAEAAEADGFVPRVKKRLSKNKRLTIVVAVVAVVAVVGVGFATWSTSPSFCSALCHSPLQNYVENYVDGYYATEGAPAGIRVHANAGLNCLSCHSRSAVRQLGEVAHWATDSYEVDDEGFLVKDETLLTKEFCTQSGCHTWEAVVDSTWGFAGNDEEFNPHASHQDGSVTCSDCHSIHKQSQLYCAKCHDLNLPEGWVATSE